MTAAAHQPQQQPLTVSAAVLGQPTSTLMARRSRCRVAWNLAKAAATMPQLQSQQAILRSLRKMLLQLQIASLDWVWTDRVSAET